MNTIDFSLKTKEYELKNLNAVNILLGKNGCGKSTLLREVSTSIENREKYGSIKYITPERGGVLMYDPGIANTLATNKTWEKTRQKNRLDNFRQQTVAQFSDLEMIFLRELEADSGLGAQSDYNFDQYLRQINQLLDNIKICRNSKEQAFSIYSKEVDETVSPDKIRGFGFHSRTYSE